MEIILLDGEDDFGSLMISFEVWWFLLLLQRGGPFNVTNFRPEEKLK